VFKDLMKPRCGDKIIAKHRLSLKPKPRCGDMILETSIPWYYFIRCGLRDAINLWFYNLVTRSGFAFYLLQLFSIILSPVPGSVIQSAFDLIIISSRRDFMNFKTARRLQNYSKTPVYINTKTAKRRYDYRRWQDYGESSIYINSQTAMRW